MIPLNARRDFALLLSSRICTRVGDGFLRIIAVLLVAEKSNDPMVAALVLVSRYICEILINAVSGPFIDRFRIRTSLMLSDFLRFLVSVTLILAVFNGSSHYVYLVLSFLGDFVFIFFKPAVDKVVKVSFPVSEGTKILSEVDAVNHLSNITGYSLASFTAVYIGLHAAVCLSPVLFLLSCALISQLRLQGESVIDYASVRKKSYWASQREGLRYTWDSLPLRLVLIGRSLVAVGRGAFTALSVVYLADIAKGLSAYGYFESAQSGGKVVATALIIPFFFAYRSTFLLTALSEVIIGVAFLGFNLAGDVNSACAVGALLGIGQASEAVGLDAQHQPVRRGTYPGEGKIDDQLRKPPVRTGIHRSGLFSRGCDALLRSYSVRLDGHLPRPRRDGLLFRMDGKCAGTIDRNR